MRNSKVKDLGESLKGITAVEWAESRMPVLMNIKERFRKEKPLEGVRIGACLHVTKETGVLIRILAAGGAEVSLCGSNPLSTQDEVAAVLAEEGVRVFAWRGLSTDEYYWCVGQVLSTEPQVTVDDGADLVSTLHREKTNLLGNVYGGTEETTTGVVRLRVMASKGALRYPIVAVNDAQSKSLFDNPLGTGQSALDGIIRSTNILFAGKEVVVVGFGRVGTGIAERARGLGSKVSIVEVDPIKALKAAMTGYTVRRLDDAAEIGEVFITATGDINVIRREHFKVMRDGAILANAGHFDVEICKSDLQRLAVHRDKIAECVERFEMKDGKRLFLLAEGRLVNLGCAEGHPSDVMDLSFSLQALCIEYIVKMNKNLPLGVLDVPKDIDSDVARLKLETMNLEAEKLTDEQKLYLSSWEEGTK